MQSPDGNVQVQERKTQLKIYEPLYVLWPFLRNCGTMNGSSTAVHVCGKGKDKNSRFQFQWRPEHGVYRFYHEESKQYICRDSTVTPDGLRLLLAQESFDPSECWMEIMELAGDIGDPIAIPISN